MTAINLGVWKPKFLLHDASKPWLQLVFSRQRVRKWHRKFSNHHKESIRKIDAVEMIVDWECSHLTKPERQMNARQFLYAKRPELVEQLEPLLQKLGL